jgi:hypothetical protein
VPVNSPEARTGCPAEWKRAKKAREDLLGAGSRQTAARAAARAVLAQAECEHRRFASWRIDAGSQSLMASELRAARRQYLSTRTLYEEAARYGDAGSAVGAWARTADLHLAFVRKLDELPAPLDVHDPGARDDYRRQMRELMAAFEVEAALAATRALEAAGSGAGATEPSDEIASWVQRSCEKLAVLDPESLASFPACGAEDAR